MQLAHFLAKSGRDFVLLERAPQAASFFAKYPIHRTLNSINRRHTRSGNLNFNLRHDHNSLIGTEESIGRFTQHSKEYWPLADDLVKHINAFAAPLKEDKKLRFCQNVWQVEACSTGEDTVSSIP